MARKPSHPPETINLVLALHDELVPLTLIARRVGLSYGSVSQIIHKNNAREYKLSFVEWLKHRERIIWLMKEGVTLEETARIYAVKPADITSIVGESLQVAA